MTWRRLAITLLAAPPLGLAAVGLLFLLSRGQIAVLLVLPGIAAVVGVALASAYAHTVPGPGTLLPRTVWSPPGPGASPIALRRHGVRTGRFAGAATAVAVLVVSGLVAVAGAATVPLLLAVVLLAAGAAWVRRRERLDDRTAPGPGDPDCPLERVLGSLSTPELCVEWQRSLRALAATTDPAARDDIAELRRVYLDEIERRDPDALTRWLALDEHPADSDPRRHLSGADEPGEDDEPDRAA